MSCARAEQLCAAALLLRHLLTSSSNRFRDTSLFTPTRLGVGKKKMPQQHRVRRTASQCPGWRLKLNYLQSDTGETIKSPPAASHFSTFPTRPHSLLRSPPGCSVLSCYNDYCSVSTRDYYNVIKEKLCDQRTIYPKCNDKFICFLVFFADLFVLYTTNRNMGHIGLR